MSELRPTTSPTQSRKIVKRIPEKLQVAPVSYTRDIKKIFNDMAVLHYRSF